MKEFDQWNILKQKIQKSQRKLFIKERQIWYVHLGKNIGFEEDGKGSDFKRPVIVLKRFGDIFVTLPLTTKGRDNHFYYKLPSNLSRKPSKVILSQIRVIDRARFFEKVDTIPTEAFKDIKKKLTELIL